MTFPFGKHKGLELSDPSVEFSYLAWFASVVKESIENPDKANWKAQNESLYQDLVLEMAARQQPE